MTFAGKYAFGSANPSGQQYFLTTFTEPNPPYPQLPAMSATAVSPSEHCILYSAGSGTVVQLASLNYLTLNSSLNWIQMSTNPADAVPIQITTNGSSQTWQVQTQNGLQLVGYDVGVLVPMLTANPPGPDGYQSFQVQQITPPLSVIVQSANGAGYDFGNVDLSNQNLAGINFSGANFSGANLAGTIFDNCNLTGAHFESAVLTGTSFNNATLDKATFTGASTNISAVKWGQPASAIGTDFSNCQGPGMQLGASGTSINCSGANFGGADLRGANLSHLNLANATLSGALMGEGCNCTSVVFDGSTLNNLLAVRGNFSNASFQNVTGHGANFVEANLSNAVLTDAVFGSKQFLFTVSQNFAQVVQELDSDKFVQPDLAQIFAQQGYTLSSSASVQVVAAAQDWRVIDPAGPFSLLANQANTGINVFLDASTVSPAVFTSAIMTGVSASGASFAAADLSGVLWGGNNATADHADFESATVANAMLIETDFTQAHLTGADFTGSVLMQAKLRGCVVTMGQDNRATTFSFAMLQGLDCTAANISSGLLPGASVALPQGVPLFVMPSSYAPDLNTAGLPQVASYFAQQGWALGQSPGIGQVQAWSIDNSSDTVPNSTRYFTVRNQGGQLKVYDGTSGLYLFAIGENLLPFLNQSTPAQPLIAQFSSNNYNLASTAAITSANYWQITNSNDVSTPGPITYTYINIYQETDGLHVYGAIQAWLRDYPSYTSGIAFAATQAIQPALNPQTICPNGYPMSLYNNGLFTWEEMLTVGG